MISKRQRLRVKGTDILVRKPDLLTIPIKVKFVSYYYRVTSVSDEEISRNIEVTDHPSYIIHK